jgi:hypothetical protein
MIGLPNGWDSGAVSTKAIQSGDGYVEFTASPVANSRICGLSNGDTTKSFTDIDFSISANPSGYIDIWENGNFVSGGIYTYQDGDHFRVALQGGFVNYYLINPNTNNGTLLYTSAVRLDSTYYPLRVDTSLNIADSRIVDVKIAGSLVTVP